MMGSGDRDGNLLYYEVANLKLLNEPGCSVGGFTLSHTSYALGSW